MTAARRIARYGWLPDLPDHRDKIVAPPSQAMLDRVAATPKHDLSGSAFMPPVWDQGQLGSCTAHAVGAAYEFAAHATDAKIGTPSRLYIYYKERELEGTISQDAGAELRDGFKVLAAGVPPETDWPYDITKFADAPPPKAVGDAKAHLTSVYQSVPQQEAAIKAILLGDSDEKGRLVSIGFTVYDSFESQAVAQSGVVPMPAAGESVLGGHAVAMCGWDDTMAALGLTGFWKVRNSWGTGWGQAGYFWMPKQYLLNPNLSSDFWTAEFAA